MAMQMASILSCFIRKWVLVFANVRKIGGLKRSFFVTIGIFANMNEKTIPTIAHKAHPWHGIELGPNCPDELRVFIEIVPTDTVKYEVDKVSGYLSLDRPQKFSNIVPSLYGFIPRSYCGSRMAGLTNEAIARYDVKGDYNSDGTERGYFKYEPALVPVPKTTQDVVNPFKKFTDELAKTLKVKNDAYADSFDKTLDKFGLNVAVARINDKYDRLENIILHPDTEQNDESPKDTLMDLAGYSILLVKYMESRGLYSD